MLRRDKTYSYLFLAPALGGFLVFYLVPFFINLGYSFTSGAGAASLAGFSHYSEVLSSVSFRLALVNTVKFMAITLPCETALSFAIAYLLNKSCRWVWPVQWCMLAPLFLPVLTTLAFMHMFLKDAAGLAAAQSLGALVVLFLWKYTGLCVLFFLTGLQSVPKEYIDLARMEGASAGAILRKAEFPLLTRTIFLVIILTLINGFKIFRESYLLSGAHPKQSLYMLPHFLYNNFQNVNIHRISASACLGFLVVLAGVLPFCLVLFRKGHLEL